MINKEILKLVYVRPVTDGKDKHNYEYDFLFSETPDVVWGVDWTDNTPNLCGDISPEPSTYSIIKRLRCPIELKTIQENSCYSMEYAINETARRRSIQEEYNRVHDIVPKTIIKEIRDLISNVDEGHDKKVKISKKEQVRNIETLENEMREAAKSLDFERAMELRDLIFELKSEI